MPRYMYRCRDTCTGAEIHVPVPRYMYRCRDTCTGAEIHVQGATLPYRDHTISHLQCYNTHDNDIRREVHDQHNITWLADQQPACRDRTHAETHVQQCYIHVSISLPYRDHTIRHLQCYNIHT